MSRPSRRRLRAPATLYHCNEIDAPWRDYVASHPIDRDAKEMYGGGMSEESLTCFGRERGETMARSFQMAIDLLGARKAKVIVETGCMRRATPMLSLLADGAGTLIFGQWATLCGAHLYSVDIDFTSVTCARMNTTNLNVTVVHSDSIAFLKTFEHPIDFLYLDSLDYDVNNPGPAQKHCLNELLTAEDKLSEDAIVMIDDCDLPGGGKGPLAINYLLDRGWETLSSQRQVILSRIKKAE